MNAVHVRYEGKAHERPGYTESMAGVHSSISAQVGIKGSAMRAEEGAAFQDWSNVRHIGFPTEQGRRSAANLLTPYAIFKFAVVLWQSFDDDIRCARHAQANRAYKKRPLADLEFVLGHNPSRCTKKSSRPVTPTILPIRRGGTNTGLDR